MRPIGLGARDSLRLEAGLCLYGNDIDTTTTPVEADLEWAIQKAAARAAPARAAFQAPTDPGQLEMAQAPSRRPRPEATRPSADVPLFCTRGADKLGEVTSGRFGPSVDGPVAMGYVPLSHADNGTTVYAEVRGKYLPVIMTALPFVSNKPTNADPCEEREGDKC